MLLRNVEVDEAALGRLVEERYGGDAAGLRFAPVGGDGWHYRCPPYWVSVRRDRQGHWPEAYAAAGELARNGLEFVLAPLGDAEGQMVHRVGRFPVVVLPLVEGATLDDTGYGEGVAARVAELCERLHAARCSVRLPMERYGLPFMEELREGMAAVHAGIHTGPYGAAVRELVVRNGAEIERMVEEIGELAMACRADETPPVLTHGEPNGGNVLRVNDGRLYLIDWGDLAYGPPERDWSQMSGLGLDLPIRPAFGRFYELRWVLSEVAEYVARFAAPHVGSAEDEDKWNEMGRYLR